MIFKQKLAYLCLVKNYYPQKSGGATVFYFCILHRPSIVKSFNHIMAKPDISAKLRVNIASAVIKTHTAYRLRLLNVFMQAGLDITPDMYFILRYLWGERDGCRQQELADRTGKDKASLTKLLDNLEKRDLVKRAADETDRRSKRIWLTGAGKKLKEKVYPLALSVVELAERGLSRNDLLLAQGVLECIYNNIRR